MELINSTIHPSLLDVYRSLLPRLQPDFDRFLRLSTAAGRDDGGRDEATGALDGLHYSRGLEVLCSRHGGGSNNECRGGNRNVAEDVGGRYPYSFICQQGYESYERDGYSSSALPTTTPTAPSQQEQQHPSESLPACAAHEGAASNGSEHNLPSFLMTMMMGGGNGNGGRSCTTTSSSCRDLVVRAENPHNLEFWLSNIPYQPGQRNGANDGTRPEKENTNTGNSNNNNNNNGSNCPTTYTGMLRRWLERKYSSFATSSSDLQLFVLQVYDCAATLVEMDQLKHAIDMMEDLGLDDDIVMFGVDRYLREYVRLVGRYLAPPNSDTKNLLELAIPRPVRTNAVQHRGSAARTLSGGDPLDPTATHTTSRRGGPSHPKLARRSQSDGRPAAGAAPAGPGCFVLDAFASPSEHGQTDMFGDVFGPSPPAPVTRGRLRSSPPAPPTTPPTTPPSKHIHHHPHRAVDNSTNSNNDNNNNPTVMNNPIQSFNQHLSRMTQNFLQGLP